MGRRYEHLSSEERAVIMVERSRGSSLRHIAGVLGRSPSTISRELSRNRSEGATCSIPSGYDSTCAAIAYRDRRQRCGRRRRLVPGSALYQWVTDRLIYERSSPEQIASRLRLMYPDEPQRHVSHETIYAAIYASPHGSLKKAMLQVLRQGKPTRGQKRTTLANGGGMVTEKMRIVHRPEEIETRQFPGHWEGDFIKGAFNRSAVGTLVVRKTRFVVLCKMEGCTVQAALEGFTCQMKRFPAFLRQSMTETQGSEKACHEELARRLKLDIWFADLHAPWQRGSNENTNGLLRQFLPKGADLSEVSQTQLNDIARLLNGRPRKTLGWKTPEEVMTERIQKFSKRVALDS